MHRGSAGKIRLVWLTVMAVVLGVGVAAYAAEGLRWRIQVVALRAAGSIPDISWGDLAYMIKPGSGYYLAPLVRNRSPYQTILSPLGGKEAQAEGAKLFLQRCAVCHGADGAGDEAAPALKSREFTHGSSDWAMFRTIRYGIANTPMVGHALDHADIWRLVLHVRSLASIEPDHDPAADAALANRQLAVSPEDLLSAGENTSDWLTFSGSYSSQRFTKLNQIDKSNVSRIAIQWIHQFEDISAEDRIVASPIVRDGVIFVTSPPGTLEALDAKTGEVLWRWKKQLPERVIPCCGFVNRGIALTGDRVILGTLDAHLIALDAKTGKQLWDVTMADYKEGFAMTGAPLAINDVVIAGIGGGDYPTRGFIDAYDIKTGERRWRFYTIPEPGQPGNETWKGDSWRTGGAGSWTTGSYDPKLNLIYWGVGNPVPNHSRGPRSGDNLYSNSVVALDADTGKLSWHFQFTPGDDHDWDSTQTPVLADLEVDGKLRQLLLFANRNAFYYVLDRTNGQFLRAMPFARQTWAKEILPSGKPVRAPGAEATPQGSLVYPSAMGATNWWPPSHSPTSGLFYIPLLDGPGIYFTGDAVVPDKGTLYPAGYTQYVPNQTFHTAVRAVDPVTGESKWEYRFPPRDRVPAAGGLLSSAGGLVFGSDRRMFFALDSDTGKMLWSLETGGSIAAAPISFARDGRQYILISAGRTLLAFALPQ
jgi:alcohol dehydrogenase (cytochrome c)